MKNIFLFLLIHILPIQAIVLKHDYEKDIWVEANYTLKMPSDNGQANFTNTQTYILKKNKKLTLKFFYFFSNPIRSDKYFLTSFKINDQTFGFDENDYLASQSTYKIIINEDNSIKLDYQEESNKSCVIL